MSAPHAHTDHLTEPGTGAWPTEHRAILEGVLEGVDLTLEDGRHLDWLAGWDCSTVGRVADLFRKAREA